MNSKLKGAIKVINKGDKNGKKGKGIIQYEDAIYEGEVVDGKAF